MPGSAPISRPAWLSSSPPRPRSSVPPNACASTAATATPKSTRSSASTATPRFCSSARGPLRSSAWSLGASCCSATRSEPPCATRSEPPCGAEAKPPCGAEANCHRIAPHVNIRHARQGEGNDMAEDAKALIELAVRRFLKEVPALEPLKLVVGAELRGGGDGQPFRLEIPGIQVTKGACP